MYTLIIETSTERAIVAFINESQNLSFFAGLPVGLSSSRYLISKIDEGLHCLNAHTSDIERIIVGNGPGSYTGIRIGVAAAKTLSYVHKIPMVPICSLEGLIPDRDSTFAAMIDAKISGAYLLLGVREGEIIKYTSKPAVCPLEEIASKLTDVEIITTPICERLKNKLNTINPHNNWDWQETSPDPLHLYKLGLESQKKGKFSIDGTLEIMYLR